MILYAGNRPILSFFAFFSRKIERNAVLRRTYIWNSVSEMMKITGIAAVLAMFAGGYASYIETAPHTQKPNRPKQGAPGQFRSDLLYDMGSLRDCLMFNWQINRHTGESRDSIRARIIAHISSHPAETNVEEEAEDLGTTPLYLAYIMNDKELVQLLLANGANPQPPTGRSFSPECVLRGLSPNPEIDALIQNAVKGKRNAAR